MVLWLWKNVNAYAPALALLLPSFVLNVVHKLSTVVSVPLICKRPVLVAHSHIITHVPNLSTVRINKFYKKPATSARRADHAANIQFNTFDVSTYSTVQYMCAQI
jgi:hypothetical protein